MRMSSTLTIWRKLRLYFVIALFKFIYPIYFREDIYVYFFKSSHYIAYTDLKLSVLLPQPP